ncbi:MAG: TonB-dependent receptor [Pseudomonadota bacterium]
MYRRSIVALVLPLTMALDVSAQSANEEGESNSEAVQLDEIVVQSANRVETPISDVTRSITVVTSDELQAQRSLDRSAGSVLSQTVPGFSPSTQALTNFGQQLRGRNFQTLIDGVPQDTPLRNGSRSLQSIDIDAVEQIEVIRGGSAIYGFGADGGLVNLITKRPKDGAVSVVAQQGISFSTNEFEDSIETDFNLQASGRSGAVDYVLGGTFVNRGNTFDADGNRRVVDPVGAQGGLDESKEVNLLSKLGYQIDDDQRLQAGFNFFNLKQDADFGLRSSTATGGLFDPPGEPEVALPGNDQDAKPGNKATNATLNYKNDNLLGSSVDLLGYYQQIDTVFTLFPGFDQTQIESEKFGTRLTVKTPIELDPVPFDVTWGVDYLKDDTGQFAIVGDESARGDQDAIAGFAQIDVPIGDYGTITGGIRYEDLSIDVTEVEPTGELNGSETLFNASASAFLTENLTLFGGFSQSFSPGDILRVLTDGSFATTDDVELEFVKTDNYEAGIRATFDNWDAEAAVFYSESNNGTSFDEDLNILTRPEEIWGFEASVNVHVTEQIGFGGTLSLIDGQVDLDDDGDFDEDLPTTRIPPTKVTLYGDYSPYEWWDLRAQVLYSGTQSNDSTDFGGGVDIDDYVLVDVLSSFNVGAGELTLGVTNLFDNDYLPVINQAFNSQFSNVQGPGRRIGIGFTIKF